MLRRAARFGDSGQISTAMIGLAEWDENVFAALGHMTARDDSRYGTSLPPESTKVRFGATPTSTSSLVV
jgi:hypothetical protein